ncbi:membrane protein, partial [Pseudomonas sp. TJI-51]
EPLSLRLLLASVVVLGGIALALAPRRQALQAKPRKSCAGP